MPLLCLSLHALALQLQTALPEVEPCMPFVCGDENEATHSIDDRVWRAKVE